MRCFFLVISYVNYYFGVWKINNLNKLILSYKDILRIKMVRKDLFFIYLLGNVFYIILGGNIYFRKRYENIKL